MSQQTKETPPTLNKESSSLSASSGDSVTPSQEGVDFSKLFNIKLMTELDLTSPVIVIEDQQDLRLILAHHLQKLQFSKIRHASNGYEGLEVLGATLGSSAIICDFDMPVMGGLEMLAELRERTDLVRPPFCIAMANVSKEKIMLAIESGVDEIIVKPFTLKDVFPKLLMAFKKFHNPRNPEKVYELAKEHLRENNWRQAEQVYKILSESSPSSARPWVGLARVAMGEGRLDQAQKYLDEAERRNKSYVHLYALRGEIFLQLNQFDAALKAFDEAINFSPLNPVRYRSAADILMTNERYKEAVVVLERAVKNGLEYKELFIHLSQAYFMQKEYSKALKHVRTALAFDPENVVYLNQLGICLRNLKQLDEAAKVYNQIIKLDQDNVAALYNKAMLCDAKNEVQEAIKLLQRAIKKDPEFEAAKNKLAELQSKAGSKT